MNDKEEAKKEKESSRQNKVLSNITGIPVDELKKLSEEGNKVKARRQSKKVASPKSGKKKGSKARRVTRTRRLGVQDDTVEVKIASDISEYSTPLSIFRLLDQVVPFGFDSNFQLTSDRCIIDEEVFSIRSLKRSTSVGIPRDSYAVIDPGAEMEVIGGISWRILHFLKNPRR